MGSKSLLPIGEEFNQKISSPYMKQSIFIDSLCRKAQLEHIYKPHYDYQNFSPLANETDLDRQKYTILQTH